VSELSAEVIQKYKKYSIPQLKKKAQVFFNAWIRKRDQSEQCISCDSYKLHSASHFYSAGHYNSLRFNEDNVHASCHRCNYFLSGNLIEYRKKLIKRIGEKRVVTLDLLADHKFCKHDSFTLISIIEKYK